MTTAHITDLDLLTGEEVMQLLKIKRTTLYELVRSGKIRRITGVRKLLFTRGAVASFIANGEATHAKA